MGSCERGAANANVARKRKAEGKKEMSRLAGAGGAAERALMNDHADPGQPKAGGIAGSEKCVHTIKFTGKMRRDQDVQLFIVTHI